MTNSQLLQIRDDGRGMVQREAAMQLQSISCSRPSLTLADLLDDLQRYRKRRW
jgi:hypothetical protein